MIRPLYYSINQSVRVSMLWSGLGESIAVKKVKGIA
jgi:hypothetical protein